MLTQQTSGAWSLILDEISRTIQQQPFNTWFRAVEAKAVGSERVELEVPNAWTKDWMVKYYHKVIQEAAAKVLSAQPEIVFRVRPMAAPAPAQTPAAPPETYARPQAGAPAPPAEAGREDSLRLNDEHTFDNFVVGQPNRLAHAAAQMVADAPAHTFNPLFLYGDVGLGKTHLLQAICHRLKAQHPHLRLRYVSCEMFINDFITSLQHKTVEKFRQKYRQVDVLLVDDIHFLAEKSSTQDEFYHTFNALFSDKKQIILSSDGPPEAIPTLEQRLLSRLKWGMVATIGKPDYEMRLLILKKKSELRGTPFPEDVVQFIASHDDTNIRELEGAVVKLVGHSMLTQKPISLALAQEVFQGYMHEQGYRLTLQDIQGAVTEHFGVKLSDLQSKKRSRAVALPRQVCMYLARRLTGNSLQEIGRYFGGRDHSTVIYACEQVEGRIRKDAKLQDLVADLSARLKRSAL